MKTFLKITIPLVLVVGFFLMVVYFMRSGSNDRAEASDWTCSMHPQIRQAKPGKCPICGMDLVPVSLAFKEKEHIEKRAGIFTEPVQRRELFKELRTVGKLDYNERQTAYITARIAGRVDEVHADITGIQVKKGHHLVDIYSPDLYIAQAELIRALEAYNTAKKNSAAGESSFVEVTLEAARLKLKLLGILPEQIQEIEKTKVTKTHLTIYADIGGTVVEKNVRRGQYVKEGDVLYRIADLDPIWLNLDIYEYDLAWVRFGQKVEVTVEAYPGKTFPGTITFINPFLDDKTRTVKARVTLANSQKELRPEMYASASIRVKLQPDGTSEPTGLEGKYICPMHPDIVKDKGGTCPLCKMPLERVPETAPPKTHVHKAENHKGHEEEHGLDCHKVEPGKVLAIRASAVLDTGRRKVTYRRTTEGAFELVELKLGPRADGKDDSGKTMSYYLVLSGLSEGDLAVVEGGFLLDSQRQIEGMPSLLFPEGSTGVDPHGGHGISASKLPANTEHKH